MNLANFIPAVLGILGISKFAQVDGKDTLTVEEEAKLKSYGFDDRFIRDFKAHLESPKRDEEGSENRQMAVVASLLASTTQQLNDAQAQLAELQAAAATDKETIAAKEAHISQLVEKVSVLSAMPEPDVQGASAGSAAPTFNLMDNNQLGGMPGVMNSLSRPYNLRAKAAMLAAMGQYMTVPLASYADFSSLREDLGAFYRTPWKDRLQSLLVELPSITAIFPTESGHQDLDTLVNIWLGDFSQADNTVGSTFDNVTKGSYAFVHETLRMYDVMFVHRFSDLKQLEHSWIGYLNREGSNALKLSFIEYLLVETAKQLHNERELRWVNGVRKDPNPNVPGRSMEAADGIYEYLRKKIEGHVDFTPNGGTAGKIVYQIKPFELPEITPSNIGEVFYLGTQMVPSVFRDTQKLVLYVPSFMLPWYDKYNEIKYGQNTDYKGAVRYVKEFPSVKIKAIPNADNHHRIFWTIDGNIKTYDLIAGEMFRFNLEPQDWSLKAWSEWKEGIAAEAVGYKYTNPADMDGSRQLIWCNQYDLPTSYFIAGDKDTNPSVLRHSSVLLPANYANYEITDIADAKVGVIVALKAGGEGDSGVTIKKSGKFSLITADWTPAMGEVIKLMKRADGKFIEIARLTATAGAAFQFEADAVNPSVSGATVFVTGDNTKATALTGLADAVVGVVYTIHGNGSANATTIANSGSFVLTAAMTLSAGKYIKLVKGEDGKFYEIARG